MSIPEQVTERTEASLEEQLRLARFETDSLFSLISENDLYSRPLPQRHRLIFYVGHLEAFDWNQLGRLDLRQAHLNHEFEQLFERGIDPEPGQLPHDQPSDWPSLSATREYVSNVRERIDALFSEASPTARQIVVEHRWMHAETLAYLFHNLPHDRKQRPFTSGMPEEESQSLRAGSTDQRLVAIPAGKATLGLKRGDSFGWDNEFEEQVLDVPAFSVAKYKVTNGEYMEYVQEGHEAPAFWTCLNGEWCYRGMFEMIPLPPDAPVYVTQIQAAAFAKWRGERLLSEPEFHRAAFGTPEGNERVLPWGADANHPAVHGNFDCRHWDPVPVTAYAGGRSAWGVAQLIGNGWEWTHTPFRPFPGFQAMPTYPGYSADFFDDRHFVLKGASPRTAAILTRRSFRNWFRPDYPYVYATFRLAEGDQ